MTTTQSTQSTQRVFEAWPKLPRLNRGMVITEKIDGTNACIIVTEDDIYAQSRNRIITPDADNHGFANWVEANKEELREQLGIGRHFGEWWGTGIGKRYTQFLPKDSRFFSLFNTSRWHTDFESNGNYQCLAAPLCHAVPVLKYFGGLNTNIINETIDRIRDIGSQACQGAPAEGVVVYHGASRQMFKVTLEHDDIPKGIQP